MIREQQSDLWENEPDGAVFNEQDINHERIVSIVRYLVERRFRTFTTNFILAETHALVLSRKGRARASEVLRHLDRGSTVVVRVSQTDEQRARTIIEQYADKDFSRTDATSFAVMDRIRIGRAVTLDDHFAQFGFSIGTTDS